MTRIVQISDTHITPDGVLFQDRFDTAAALRRMLAGLKAMLPRLTDVEGIVVSGDVTETGCAAAHARFAAIMAESALPWRAIPGNHDSREAMRASLKDLPWMPGQGPVNWREDLGALTLLGLDTLVEGAAHGALSDATLNWLGAVLKDVADRPVLLFMHHPPIDTGIGAMDRIGLRDRPRLAQVLSGHGGRLQIACGHVHRMTVGHFAGRQVTIAPGMSVAVGLDLRRRAALGFVPTPGGALLHGYGDDFRTMLITPEDFA